MGEKKKSISISLEPNVIERIREHSEKDRRSISQYISLVMEAHFQGTKIKSPAKKNDMR